VYLPNARFSVPVTRSELPPDPLAGDALIGLQETPQWRAKKYAAARSAAVITLKTGETAIVWTGDALLAPAVNQVLLPRVEFDPANCVYVPWSRAVQDLSGIVEEIQRTPSRDFFDAIGADDSRWQQLVDSGAPIDQLNRESD
jgi:hypothetical protein